MPYVLTIESRGDRFEVERVGLDYPITLLMPFSVLSNDEQGAFGFVREALQADIDDRNVPPTVAVLSIVKPPDGGEIVTPATQEQVDYFAACAEQDLGADHPGVAELRSHVVEV